MIEQRFHDRQAASQAAAQAVAAALRQRLRQHGHAAIVVSGGSTPAQALEMLSSEPLDWARVQVVPSDERWVPVDHADSNERMIRSCLLRNTARDARLFSLYREDVGPDDAADFLQSEFAGLPLPLAVSLLGMGEDGHFASLFPDFDGIGEALEPENGRCCMAVRTRASPLTRISLTLSALTRSDMLLLLAFGEKKRRVIERAGSGDASLPLTALLEQNRAPVKIMWAP